MKQTWLIISNIIHTKNHKAENTEKKIIQDDAREDSEDIANMVTDYFVDRGKNRSIGGNNDNHLYYVAQINQPSSIFFRPIHCYSAEKIICSLKNKCSNLNTIYVKILKINV